MTTGVTLDAEYPETLSRKHALLKLLFGWLYVGIPHLIVLYVLSIVAAFVTLIAFFAILFTGKFPRGMFDFVVGVQRWSWRVNAYLSFLTDKYPPFSLK